MCTTTAVQTCESILYPLLPGGGEAVCCNLPVDRPAFPGYGRCAHGHVTALLDLDLLAEVEAGRACGSHDRPMPCVECA